MSLVTEAAPAQTLTLSQLPRTVHLLRECLASGGRRAYLVGGAVRDAILGMETGDLDVAVQGDSLVAASALALRTGGSVVVLDEMRGIVRVAPPPGEGQPQIDVTPIEGAIDDDLRSRDFTLDAMAVALHHDGSVLPVIDPLNGMADAKAGLVRVTSPDVFDDDPGRLMRAPRLAAQLRFEIEDSTRRAIRTKAHLVQTVAAERVRDELLKLLAEPNAAVSLRLLDDLDLLCRVLPELSAARGVTQPKEHYWDVFNHSIETVAQLERVLRHGPAPEESDLRAIPRFDGMGAHFAEDIGDGRGRLAVLKLACLLHDIAKPETRTVEPSGRVRFLGHHTVGAETAGRIAERLRLSRRAAAYLTALVEHHLRPSQMAAPGELPSRRALYRYYRDVDEAAIDTLYLNLADYLGARGPDLDPVDWQEHCRVVCHILSGGTGDGDVVELPKLIDGNDLMQTFDLEPGPLIGELLETVWEAQAEGLVSSREDASELVRSRLSKGVGIA